MNENKKFCTSCGHDLNKKDKRCPNCNSIIIKEKNILAIMGMITIALAVLLEILYVIIVSINKDFENFYLLGMCVASIGFIFCIIAITKRNIYKKNYNIITYIMIFISVILINGMPIVDRILGVPVEEDCCSTLDTTIDWNANEK